jgi:hypothetical protein
MAKGQFSKENESSLLTTESRGGIVEFEKVQVREMRDAQTILVQHRRKKIRNSTGSSRDYLCLTFRHDFGGRLR